MGMWGGADVKAFIYIALVPAEYMDEAGERRLKITLTVPSKQKTINLKIPSGYVFVNP